MDGRADRHRHATGPPVQRRAAAARASVSRLQRDGRRGSQGAGRVPEERAAVKRANQPKRIAVPLFESVFLPAWLAAFAPRETPPSSAPTAGVPRGEYLVRAVAHCGECHTPRTLTMATDHSRFLAGNPQGPEDQAMPNIPPDVDTGTGKW